jgi:hypothetical protein
MMIVVTHSIHTQSDHVDCHPTKRVHSITIQLKTPPAGNHAKNIEQKPWRSQVDVHNIPGCIDVATNHEWALQIKIKIILWIIVAIKKHTDITPHNTEGELT